MRALRLLGNGQNGLLLNWRLRDLAANRRRRRMTLRHVGGDEALSES